MKVKVHPAFRLEGKLQAQPSKNYTTRYLYAAALADGESVVENIALSEDARALLQCLETLGAQFTFLNERTVQVRGFGRTPLSGQEINPGNAGTVLRLLLGISVLTEQTSFTTDYTDSLGRRPNDDLLKALSSLDIEYTAGTGGTLPLTIRGISKVLPENVELTVSGEKSSQFLSSLLFLAPLLDRRVEIRVTGNLKSAPLIRQTLQVQREAGISVDYYDSLTNFVIKKGQSYQPGKFVVGGDHPGTAAILGICCLVPSHVEISNLLNDEQGEKNVIPALQEMGADLDWKNGRVLVRGGKTLRGIQFNGDRATDAVQALSAVTCVAEGTSRFYNVENLRYKECDRISDWGKELLKMGVPFREEQDAFEITGNPAGYEGGMYFDSHQDHRVIMGLTLIGARCKKPIIIENAQHIAKSYPDFFAHLQQLGARVEIIEDENIQE